MIYLNGVAIVGDMFKAVYDANDNSRIEKDAMGITLNKLLKGAGAGVNPTEIDVPTGAPTAIGTYTGDDSVNRAIAHGLGVTPKMVFILDAFYGVKNWIHPNDAFIYAEVDTTKKHLAVTAMNTTNFYVGNAGDADRRHSANETGSGYFWAAFG